MRYQQVFIASLGCSKNTVDSDSMAQLLLREGYELGNQPEKADILIVNTCGFIDIAREESLEVLSQLDEIRKKKSFLIAAGCFSQRDSSSLVREVPGIDGIIGTRRWMDIVKLVKNLSRRDSQTPVFHLPEGALTVGQDEPDVIRASLQGASAYLKIADGCRRPCGFCAIPLIKGTLVSRPLERIIHEAAILNDEDIKELILISQDTTDYGHDLGLDDGLSLLLKSLIPAVPDIPWIRIMYSYPGYITDSLINLIESEEKILPYLDIPLQHANPDVLRRMRRPSDLDWVYRTISRLRDRIPHIAIRSAFIVGYPGETESEFSELEAFISEMVFDRLGVFQFSPEVGTYAENLPDQVSDEVKEERYERLMARQHEISLKKNQSFVGKSMDVLVEGYGDGISIGRSYRDAPEIDGLVIAREKLPIGEIARLKITDAMVYDLLASSGG